MHSFKAKVFALALLFVPLAALAQVPSIPPAPYNVPQTNPSAATPQVNKVFTDVLVGPGTYDSNIINNLAYNGVVCTYNRTTTSGSMSTALSILAYDSASGAFVSWLTTSTTQALTATLQAMIYPGIQTSSLPAGMVAINLKLPRFFKVRLVNTGASMNETSTVGCDLLK